MPRGEIGEERGPRNWIVALGGGFGGLVLLFFMCLLVLSIFGKQVPCDSRFLVVVVLAFGAALSASFLGGAAAAQGSIPIPFAQTKPVHFSVAGGIAVLLIFLLVGRYAYMADKTCGTNPRVTELVNAMLVNMNGEEYDSATRKADEVLQIEPANYRALSVKGSVSFYRGQYRVALDYFERALATYPGEPDLIFNIADTYIELGAFEKAIERYDSIKSDSVDWNYSQGRAYTFAKRYRDAYKLLQAVPNNHHTGTARVWSAAALVVLGRESADNDRMRLLKEARGELMAACTQSSEYWNAVLVGGRFEKRESYGHAAKLLEPIYVKKKPC